MHDEYELFIKEFFYPVDPEYKSGTFDDNEVYLKDLLRHQISNMLSGKSVSGYHIELNTSYLQKIKIGYIESKIDIHHTKPIIRLSRFYIYKLYRKLNYNKKALATIIKLLFEKHAKVSQMNIEFFESNRAMATTLVNLGFRLSQLSGYNIFHFYR